MSDKRTLICPKCGASSYSSDWQYLEEIKCHGCKSMLRVVIDKEVIIKSVTLEMIDECVCECQCANCRRSKP